MVLLKLQQKIFNEDKELKKIISAALLAGFITLSLSPVFAVEDSKKSGAAPKQYKSYVKKNKKTSDVYKYDYINMSFWQNFNDDKLNGYISKAIQNNYDLKMATLAVEEYYQQTRLQFSNELPNLNAGFAPNVIKMPGVTKTTDMYAVPVIAQYELDLFLKNRDKTKSVKKLWEGSKLDERSAYIAVASAVGTVYINLLRLDKVIDLQEEIVVDRKQIYELMALSNKEGLISTSDVVKANKSYIAGNTDLIELKKQREKLLHHFCVLIGESPENIDSIERASLDDFNYNGIIPTEIASEIIVQRPDYMKAEKMVEKAGIDVRVAKKEFLPSINLIGLAAFNSNEIGTLFSKKGMLAALGGSVMYPFFTGGSKFANLKLKKTEYERVLQNYYKTNLVAIQEVNDSLVNIKRDQEKMSETQKQADLEQKDFGFSEQKYDQGVISKLDLIQVRENLLATNKLLVTNKVECLVDYIGLYKSVGSKI